MAWSKDMVRLWLAIETNLNMIGFLRRIPLLKGDILVEMPLPGDLKHSSLGKLYTRMSSLL